MAAASVKAPAHHHASFTADRPSDLSMAYTSSPLSYANSSRKLPSFTSVRALRDEERESASQRSQRQNALRSTLRNIDTRMGSVASTSSTTTTTNNISTTTPSSASIPTTSTRRSDPQHAKLHKRSGSIPSQSPTALPPLNGSHSQFHTPYATYEEPFPDISLSLTPSNSTPKIKPYLRKISSSKDDGEQGRLDLSKSLSENEALAGLGITDFGLPRSDSMHSNGRRTPHARNTSVGSTISTGSGSFRPTQPFVHPMRQVPNRPYTPPTDASSLNDEERRESSDIVTEDDMLPATQPLRHRRSMSVSSPAQIIAPTPLSQAHTAADLAYSIPKLTSTSQTNLSIKSSRSRKSSRSKLGGGGRARADTNRSFDNNINAGIASPSSRTSLDRAISFVSRRSDPDPLSRDERIRAARRKFDEKEASKDAKAEKEELKRRQTELAKRERQRRKSEAASSIHTTTESDRSSRPRIPKASKSQSALTTTTTGVRYDDTGAPQFTALPRHGTEPGKSEKGGGLHEYPVFEKGRQGETSSRAGWTRFSAWVQTRMLSCGRQRGR